MSKVIGGAVFGAVLIYLLFVFSNAGMDIRWWPAESRSFCAFCMLFGIIIGGGLGLMIHENEKPSKF